MVDQVNSIEFARMMSYIFSVRNALVASDMLFDSEENLKSVRRPIQIFHAEDDKSIPVVLARKLYSELSENGNNVKYKEFPASEQLGHNGIWQSEKLPFLISTFVEEAVLKH